MQDTCETPDSIVRLETIFHHIVRSLLVTRLCPARKSTYCKAIFVTDRLLAHVAADERIRVHQLPPTEADGLFSIAYSACVGVDICATQGGRQE